MATQGSFGVVLKIMVSTTLTAVAHLLDIAFPEQVKELADVTEHPSSAVTGYRTFIDSGIRDLAEFEATLLWDDADSTHAAIVAAFDATAAVSMSIEDPNGSEVIAFSGHIRSIGRLAAMADGYKARVRIKPTGAPTIT